MPARSTVKPRNACVWVAVHLTRAEIRALKEYAAADLRSVGGYVAWLLAQHLKGPARRKLRPVRGPPRASGGGASGSPS